MGIKTDGRETEQDLKEIKAVLRTLYKVWHEKKAEERGSRPRAMGCVK